MVSNQPPKPTQASTLHGMSKMRSALGLSTNLTVDADILAAYMDGPAAPVDWLDPNFGGHLTLFCIHQKKHITAA